MTETGTVVFVAANGAMLVVQHSDGYALVEMIGDEGAVEKGNSVRADWSELGGGEIKKDGETFDVFFQGSWGSFAHAVAMAREAGG